MSSAEDKPLPAGTRFGTYRVERLIGTGGMGSVYEAMHVGLKKRVALKILHPGFVNNDDVKARFLREGEATARINHPHVVDVTDLGVKDGLPYLVMELLSGESLSEQLQRERVLPIERAVDVLLPIISAVGTAHDEGVVHRDLKPDNIFLAKNRLGLIEPKLLDFGISKMTTRSELTTTAMVLGTPHYLSPEQATASRDIDGRSDQYSVAVILYRLLTGTVPVIGDVVMEVLLAVAQGQIRPPRAVKPDLPEALERIILRGLATAPKDRYAHIHLMGYDLLRFASEDGRATWRAHFALRFEALGGTLPVATPRHSKAPVEATAILQTSPFPHDPSEPRLAQGPISQPIPVGAMTSNAGLAPLAPGPISQPIPVGAMTSDAGLAPLAPGPISQPIPVGVVTRNAALPTPVAPPAEDAVSPALAAMIAASKPPVSLPPVGPALLLSARQEATPSRGAIAPPTPPIGRQPLPRGRADDEPTARTFSAESVIAEPPLHGARMPPRGVAIAGALAVGLSVAGVLWATRSREPLAIATTVASYRIAVSVEPDAAEILIDGVPRGRGKIELELPADGREHTLVARMAGFVTQTISFREGKVPPDRVKLEREE